MTFEGTITATSNKVNEKFKTDNPTKTAYITVESEADRKKLEDFGLTLYSSKEDGTEFFIIKLSREVKTYDSFDKKKKPTILDGTTESPNFRTVVPVAMNVVKGENVGNDFYRVNAISVASDKDVQVIEAENPFA